TKIVPDRHHYNKMINEHVISESKLPMINIRLQFLLSLFLLSGITPVKAQNPVDVVNLFFESLNSASSAGMRKVVSENCSLQSVIDGKLHSGNMSDFYSMLDNKKKETVFEEKIYQVKWMKDGDLAMVWAPYKFYVNSSFSHCGVNLFTLTALAGEWKI